MKMSKRRQSDATEGCRTARRPSPEARARHAVAHEDAVAQASLRRMFRRF
jgi:hypothetical protein